MLDIAEVDTAEDDSELDVDDVFKIDDVDDIIVVEFLASECEDEVEVP